MLARHQEPIVAIATAAGRGAVGIVRVSGRDLRPLIEKTYALDDIHAALDRLASGQQFGKLAVRIRG